MCISPCSHIHSSSPTKDRFNMGYDDQKIQYQPEDAPTKGLYGAMPSGYSTVPPPGYGASPQAYGAPLKGPYSAPPPTYGVPLQGPYVAPLPIYVAPPPTCPCLRNDQWHAQNPHPKKTESDCEQFWTACCGALLFCCIMGAIF